MKTMQDVTYNSYCLKKQQLLMASQTLPSEFDVIVIGTGLEESIVAASAARNGHTVLHIDTNDFYGGSWSAFNFDGLQTWISTHQESRTKSKALDQEKVKELVKEGETWHQFENDSSITDVKQEWFVPEKHVDVDVEEEEVEEVKEENEEVPPVVHQEKPHMLMWDRQKVSEHGRRFNLDLVPRLLFSYGSMVELLISSNISRYTEFKSVSRVLTVLNGSLEHVPSSRADVFATRHVSVVEKRILMKYIAFCVSYDSRPEVYEAFKDKTYEEFLRHERLTDNLIHFVLHSIAMVDKNANCLEGLAATKKFLVSLGRFGNTPFLWSMYGSGELPQAFCRLCAVFGGTYYLGRSVDAIVTKDGQCTALISDGMRIGCQKLVMSGQSCPAEMRPEEGRPTVTVERKMCLMSDSIMPSEKEQLSFVSVPPQEPGQSYTYVQEVGHATAACPKGMYCLHLTKTGGGDESGIDKSLDKILQDKSRLVWSLDFKITTDAYNAQSNGNLYFCTGPLFELDYDQSIENAKNICKNMFPDEEFLPRAPDPEEIIIGEPSDADQTEEDIVHEEPILDQHNDTVEETPPCEEPEKASD